MSDEEIVLPKTPEYWSCDECHPLETHDGICLQLRRYRTAGKDAKYGAVLLMHGASGSHQTFLTPRGGLAEYLFDNGFDPWLLDWRSSGLVVDDELKKDDHGTLRSAATKYNFNAAAEFDIRSALTQMRDEGVEGPISAMGHCMGSGILAEAIALEHIGPSDVSRIVLETLGLFYEVPIEGQLKTEDRVLERFRDPTGTSALVVDPRMAEKPFKLENAWAAELDALYTIWPSALKEHVDPPTGEKSVSELDALHAMCNRACFMYGMVYEHVNLAPEIHGDATTPGLLQLLFRAIPLQMFIHGANNIRARQATTYELPDRGDFREGVRPNSDYVSDEARARFRSLMQGEGRVTLITGARNRLWHRDSIDRMYEWLSRGTPVGRRHLVKHVLTEYGHQDLLWGRDSRRDVYELIEKALKP